MPQPSTEKSTTTHENSSNEVIDESLKVFHTQHGSQLAKCVVTCAAMEKPRHSKTSVNSLSQSRSCPRKRSTTDESNEREKKNSLEEIDKSCSDITASTYCNENGVSISSGIGLDFDSGTSYVGIRKTYNERKSCALDFRNLNRSRDLLANAENLSMRRESSSTFERDMAIIDLLQRERSMNAISIQARNEPELRIGKLNPRPRQSFTQTSTSFERHRPENPKRTVTSTAAELSPSFPNFVFTHQQHLAKSLSNEQTHSRNRPALSAAAIATSSDDPSGFNAFAKSFNSSGGSGGSHSRKRSNKSMRDTRVHSNKYGARIYSDNL